ncbi:MAG TPA: gamma-glutamyl-gamma-aminobutyrate hydrolase family protein [Pedobacter sp.]|nr:gamma-glutamyl-gamma-aminobutyrate hydrolase family protein [Pedobacter sp.]
MKLKKIGISYSEANFQNYWSWFNDADLGDDLELVELSFLRNNLASIFQCDGFVLTGGIDVTPSIYDGKEIYPNMPDTFLPERDEFERAIYRYSQDHQLPLLGICRGMQYVNILEGGKVFEDNDEAAHIVHKKADTDKTHGIDIIKNSLLNTITGLEAGQANSAHHQAIDPEHLGSGLMISAYSEDQIIEAIEFKDKSDKGFMLGVQWHPERMLWKQLNPLSEHIKQSFLQAVRST